MVFVSVVSMVAVKAEKMVCLVLMRVEKKVSRKVVVKVEGSVDVSVDRKVSN